MGLFDWTPPSRSDAERLLNSELSDEEAKAYKSYRNRKHRARKAEKELQQTRERAKETAARFLEKVRQNEPHTRD